MHLTHAVVYLSMAPKSNALYTACEACKKDVKELPAEPVPLQICNAPTGLMKELNYEKAISMPMTQRKNCPGCSASRTAWRGSGIIILQSRDRKER